ncbi:MAG: hypothetical protein ACJ74X_09305 [Gaiellaceae bacterium]
MLAARLDLAVMETQKGRQVPAFEFVLRRSNRPDRIQYRNTPEAEVGDVVEIDGRPWLIVEKEPPFALRRIERIICVPRRVRRMH